MNSLNEALARERIAEWRRQAEQDRLSYELVIARRWQRLQRRASRARDRQARPRSA